MTPGRSAILYDTAGLDPARERLTGLAVATRDFLRAHLDHGAPGPLFVHPTTDVTEAAVRTRFPTDRAIRIIPRVQARALAEPGGLFVPGPVLAPFAWRRRHAGDTTYALTGITHTMSTARALDAVRELMVAPVQPWDALICTSAAIHDLVSRCLEQQAAYLAERFGIAAPMVRPMLPVIPLGVEPEAIRATPDRRAAFRARHGIADGDVAVLYLGRLAAHAKAHPIPMFRALGLAAARGSAPLVCVLAGWFHDDVSRAAFLTAAGALAPTVRVIHVDARDPVVKNDALAAGDVFLSLADNVQESFGLTPIEAMAAGLPCVVSDWDGYKDTVVEGETGFRAPIHLPPGGSGADLAWRRLSGFDNEATFHAQMAQTIAVDVEAAARALVVLADDPALRRRMGEAGRVRARSVYGWSVIIRRYEELWAEQRARRERAIQDGVAGPTGPSTAAADPFALFGGFASRDLASGARFSLATEAPLDDFETLAALPMAVLDPRLPDRGRALLDHVMTAGSVRLDVTSEPLTWRTALWLAKLGLLRIEPL
ncbi:MAG: glycosyltransferase family 4 protein [Alphaproteobacteria bacterium]|nr:glycosyltransferase family 4 protein [Alphaproteobacteria bacterium]